MIFGQIHPLMFVAVVIFIIFSVIFKSQHSSLSIFRSCSPISVIFIRSSWLGQVNNPSLNTDKKNIFFIWISESATQLRLFWQISKFQVFYVILYIILGLQFLCPMFIHSRSGGGGVTGIAYPSLKTILRLFRIKPLCSSGVKFTNIKTQLS